jgi:hypothetical protein
MSCDGRIQTFLEALASALYVDADGNVHINTEIIQTDCEDITPLILEVDFHYPIDTLGSRTSSSK